MKVAVAGLNHESNTFNPIITNEDDFVIARKNEVFSCMNSYGAINGIITSLSSFNGYEVIPTLIARAVPNGVVSRKFYLSIKSELIAMMASLKDIDAITLALHGSMRIEEIGDAEGDILETLRKIHPKIPIIAALDMHATITDKMMKNADAFVGYKCAPHTDTFETGAHAAKITHFTLENEISLTMSGLRVPILIAGEKTETSTYPMKSRISRLKEMENETGVLAASYLLGFPWADSEVNGVTPLVVTANDKSKADKLVKELAQEFWEIRKNFEFHTETYEAEEAVKKAFESSVFPTFLSDSGDNPTAGAAGDSTHLLSVILGSDEFKNAKMPVLYTGFYDPVSVSSCIDKEGESTHINLGGLFEKQAGKPVALKVKVIKVVCGWGIYDADLVHVKYKTMNIIIASKHIGWVDTKVLHILGLNPHDWKLIIVKLGYLTDPFKKIAARSIMALSRGASHEVLENLNYEKVCRPIFPLDDDFECNF